MKTYSTSGYAPSVPSDMDPLVADEYTLILMLRDTLQNGASSTRGNLALSLLVDKMHLPVPDLPLDPEPYAWNNIQGSRRSTPTAHDWIEGYTVFAPRFGYAQEQEKYRA